MQKFYPAGPVPGLFRRIYALQSLKDRNMDRFKTLTDRETEVLTLIADGLDNPAIARTLNISRATVQNHRSRIRQKLDISSQTEYITYALAYNLIQF